MILFSAMRHAINCNQPRNCTSARHCGATVLNRLFDQSSLVRIRSHVDTRHLLIFIFILSEIELFDPRTRTRLLGYSTHKWGNILCLYWAQSVIGLWGVASLAL